MSKHITKCVFARQERVEGLLDCAQHLARLGDVESAEEAFKEAIDSSLGPNWYKEDQYILVLDALIAVGDAEFSRLNWKSTVEVLAYASGESNFQRYVRDAKGSLIGHLSRSGLLAESLDLYLHYLLPSYELQATRIRQVEVDKISDLSGLRFGIQEVDEQRAALELADGLQAASPLRRWAVLELFWPWGDDRHWDGFIDILCSVLAVDMPQVIGERFLRFLRSEVSPDRRAELASEIRSRDSLGHAAPWLDRAKALGILDERDVRSSSRPESQMVDPGSLPPDRAEGGLEGDLFLPGVFGRFADYESLKGAVPLAEKRISRQDARSARIKLTEGLRSAQIGGWSIWDGSEEAKNALKLLLTETGSIESGLAALAEIVMAEEYAESWRIARRLMTIIMPRLDLRQRQAMFALASEHVLCLIAPERKNFSVSGELDALGEIDGQLTPSECADRWLVSLLDHPNCYMRERAALILEWLAVRSEFDVRLLVRAR